MGKKSYILSHCSNVAFERDFYHENLKVFSKLNDALEYLEKIDNSVKNKTCSFFKDREWGWLNPVLEEKSYDNTSHYFLLIYKWINPNNCEEVCYTKISIEEVEFIP